MRQDFLVDNGGARVWYLDKDAPAAEAFKEVVRQAMEGGIDSGDAIWSVTPFVDYPGDYGATQYRFEWEREWRVPGGLSFTPDDVPFLFIPEEWHKSARSFFEGHLEEHTGPAYVCPYVDPTWEMERIQAALEPIALPPPAVVHGAVDDACDYCGGPLQEGLCMLCGKQSLR